MLGDWQLPSRCRHDENQQTKSIGGCGWMHKRILSCLTIHERSQVYNTDIIQSSSYLFTLLFNRICGRIETVPPFKWYVEDQHPEDVSIVLKHAGLNDGYWEGLSFTLSGECLPNDSNMTSSLALKSYSNWMENLTKESQSVDLTVAWCRFLN